jgi:hypothetical protein
MPVPVTSLPASVLATLASVTVAEPLVTVAASSLPALTLAPLRVIVDDPELAVRVAAGAGDAGLQLLPTFDPFGVSTVKPAGSVSVNPTLVRVVFPVGSVIAYEMVLVSPTPIALG